VRAQHPRGAVRTHQRQHDPHDQGHPRGVRLRTQGVQGVRGEHGRPGRQDVLAHRAEGNQRQVEVLQARRHLDGVAPRAQGRQ